VETDKYNELIVFVIRETGWSLEYVRQIPYAQIVTLVNELIYQKDADNYNRNYPLGILAAILTSDKTRRRRPEDFIGRKPQRQIKKGGNELWDKAKEAGIEPPGEI